MQVQFEGEIFLWSGDKAAWRFVALPDKLNEEIDHFCAGLKAGFGSIPVTVTIGRTRWQTSIFPSKSRGVYLLPLKAAVRKAEAIDNGDRVRVDLEI